jgi:hypothetical protein
LNFPEIKLPVLNRYKAAIEQGLRVLSLALIAGVNKRSVGAEPIEEQAPDGDAEGLTNPVNVANRLVIRKHPFYEVR